MIKIINTLSIPIAFPVFGPDLYRKGRATQRQWSWQEVLNDGLKKFLTTTRLSGSSRLLQDFNPQATMSYTTNFPHNRKRTVYVGGFDETVVERVLSMAFIPFGEIVGISIPLDHESGKHRGFGWVIYSCLISSADNVIIESILASSSSSCRRMLPQQWTT